MSESRNILITGASSGIGNAIAHRLNANGVKLYLSARNLEKLAKSFPHGNNESLNVKLLGADITKEGDLSGIVKAIKEPLDGLVLSAGELKYMPAAFLNRENLMEMMNINFLAPVLLVKELIKAKKLNKNSSIIFVSSVSAKVGVAATLAYASSKAAVEAAVRVLATELAPKKIKVNAVCPGLVNTPMLEKASIENGIDISEANNSNYPLGIGSAEDVASLMSFLISKENNWITGQTVVIDGGYLLNK
ncbi:MAG: SDR family oxidoreductase [Sphingobacteriaceae bacterium]|nr:SDR family oxidoreductase [Sphingobacteriaceae bacterium]